MSLLEKHSVSSFETASHDAHLQASVRRLRLLDGARAAATLLALLVGVTVLGLAGHTVQAYNASRVGSAAYAASAADDNGLAFLSVWPSAAAGAFDFRPTVALLVGAALVVVANTVALTSHHGAVRARLQAVSAHAPLTVTAPLVGLVAAAVAVIFYYAVNRSDTADTLLSWSCRWTGLATTTPRFSTLCGTSRGGLYLAIVLIPIEALALTLAGWQLKVARYTAAYAAATAVRRTPSPMA